MLHIVNPGVLRDPKVYPGVLRDSKVYPGVDSSPVGIPGC